MQVEEKLIKSITSYVKKILEKNIEYYNYKNVKEAVPFIFGTASLN